MVSASELRDRIAQELGLLQLGQSLQSQHAARITQAYAEVYKKLKEDGYATWAYSGDVPDEFVQNIVFLAAENCLGTYGVSDKRFERIKLGARNAQRDVMKYASIGYVSQGQAEDY